MDTEKFPMWKIKSEMFMSSIHKHCWIYSFAIFIQY